MMDRFLAGAIPIGGPAKVLPQRLDISHVPILFSRGPLIGAGKEAYYMYQCNCEFLTDRK
jgi:hypothetical protein